MNKPTINPNSPYHHIYETNTIGRDFIVGDIQGCYNELMGALKGCGFNESTDRLFCVGDLIDRGPNSYECANLIYKPWVHSTMGNHELMMYQSVLHNRRDYHDCWINNGGLWYTDVEEWELKDIAKSFSELPLVISIGSGENRFNIVHAELLRMKDKAYGKYDCVTNDDIDNWTFNNFDLNEMLWGRLLVDIRTPSTSYQLVDIDSTKRYHSDELSLTYVGHSIVPSRPVRIEQHIYLDTGMCNYYKQNNQSYKHKCVLTLACPQEQTFYIYSQDWRKTTKYPYSQLRKYT